MELELHLEMLRDCSCVFDVPYHANGRGRCFAGHCLLLLLLAHIKFKLTLGTADAMARTGFRSPPSSGSVLALYVLLQLEIFYVEMCIQLFMHACNENAPTLSPDPLQRLLGKVRTAPLSERAMTL